MKADLTMHVVLRRSVKNLNQLNNDDYNGNRDDR